VKEPNVKMGSLVIGVCAVTLMGCASTSPVGRGDSVRQVVAAQTANPAGTRSGATTTDPAVIGNAVKGMRADRAERTDVSTGVTIAPSGVSAGR
jgi:hypothetical protein